MATLSFSQFICAGLSVRQTSATVSPTTAVVLEGGTVIRGLGCLVGDLVGSASTNKGKRSEWLASAQH